MRCGTVFDGVGDPFKCAAQGAKVTEKSHKLLVIGGVPSVVVLALTLG